MRTYIRRNVPADRRQLRLQGLGRVVRAVNHPEAQRLRGPEAPRAEDQLLGAGEPCGVRGE